MKRVMTTGTFDLLHYGHLNLLKKSKELGDYLIVGLNVSPEGKTPIYSYEVRKAFLEALRYVDEVIPIYRQEDKFEYLKNNKVDIFTIGSDYKGYKDIADIEKYAKVIFIERTPDISTSQLKTSLDHKKYNRLVIDVDNTICFVYNRDFVNALPNIEVIDKINSLYDEGWEIYLFTARGDNSCKTLEEKEAKYFNVTSNWLKNNGVKYHRLMFGKPNGDYYIDDKNLSIKEFLEL